MKIAFLNLCHCDPGIVERVAKKLTQCPDFHMYIHVDAKSSFEDFYGPLKEIPGVFFVENRERVYWGGYNAIKATFQLLRYALESDVKYDYFVLLQNLDYPIKSNQEIADFFQLHQGKEFIRGCNIAHLKDWQFTKKYKIYNRRDDDFYITSHGKLPKYLHYGKLLLRSVGTITSNGVIKEADGAYDLYYGAAQWAVTRECAKYFDWFEKNHPHFNERMKNIQFPDEEYFHTIVHNTYWRERCYIYDEPVKRWLVNWRNLHYFEFPKQVKVMTIEDLKLVKSLPDLFIRKVRSGESDELMDVIDQYTIS